MYHFFWGTLYIYGSTYSTYLYSTYIWIHIFYICIQIFGPVSAQIMSLALLNDTYHVSLKSTGIYFIKSGKSLAKELPGRRHWLGGRRPTRRPRGGRKGEKGWQECQGQPRGGRKGEKRWKWLEVGWWWPRWAWRGQRATKEDWQEVILVAGNQSWWLWRWPHLEERKDEAGIWGCSVMTLMVIWSGFHFHQ